MVRIAGMVFDAAVDYFMGENADIQLEIPYNYSLSEAQMKSIRDADVLEELEYSYGQAGEVIGSYSLVGWKKIERTMRGHRFAWQTYRITEVEDLKRKLAQAQQENEDLTEAVLELASIVGGNDD